MKEINLTKHCVAGLIGFPCVVLMYCSLFGWDLIPVAVWRLVIIVFSLLAGLALTLYSIDGAWLEVDCK